MTTLLERSEAVELDAPRWDLSPSVSRVASIDRALRRRLAESLAYLADVASSDDCHRPALATIEKSLKAGPVSPWVFCHYSKLVAELSKDPRGDASDSFNDIARAAALPAEEGVVAFGGPAAPPSWWDHFRLLFDTDRQRPFKPQVPLEEDFACCRRELEAALAILKSGDTAWYDEVRSLVRMVVLGAPRSADSADLFNGASTFFLWGASLLNANLRRTSISILDLLVHESSHVLLFGVSAHGGLTTNSGRERYDSPVRKDKRPIDGIFHACFVSTRVHLAMERLVSSGVLTDEGVKIARDRQEYNGSAALAALDLLECHAKPTAQGDKILDTIRTYWARARS